VAHVGKLHLKKVGNALFTSLFMLFTGTCCMPSSEYTTKTTQTKNCERIRQDDDARMEKQKVTKRAKTGLVLQDF
jgi:hypothetical protein